MKPLLLAALLALAGCATPPRVEIGQVHDDKAFVYTNMIDVHGQPVLIDFYDF